MNIDFKALTNSLLNIELLKDSNTKEITKVCNKYGIFGQDIMTFLMELNSAINHLEGESDE